MTAGINDTMVMDQWNDVLASLRDEIGEAAFQSWLKPMTVREIADGQVRISVPTRFMKDWVVAHYVDRLSELWSGRTPPSAGWRFCAGRLRSAGWKICGQGIRKIRQKHG
jgi:hypothetical protein